jgi:hypothetical protein
MAGGTVWGPPFFFFFSSYLRAVAIGRTKHHLHRGRDDYTVTDLKNKPFVGCEAPAEGVNARGGGGVCTHERGTKPGEERRRRTWR